MLHHKRNINFFQVFENEVVYHCIDVESCLRSKWYMFIRTCFKKCDIFIYEENSQKNRKEIKISSLKHMQAKCVVCYYFTETTERFQ